MSMMSIILIWIWFAGAMAILSRWPMGRESARRAAYWLRYEGK
jgi:hypothetical protein